MTRARQSTIAATGTVSGSSSSFRSWLAAVRPVGPQRISLRCAQGAVLADDVRATVPLPPFDNSAMDGYAVAAADVAAASPQAPVTLPVDDEIIAGDGRQLRLAAGRCMRIMTGAPMPSGADAVIRVEWTDGGTEKVSISRGASSGACVRRLGEDAAPGRLLLAAGTRLGSLQIGLLAAAGCADFLARPRPKAAVSWSLRPPETPESDPVQVRGWEDGRVMLAAAARRAEFTVQQARARGGGRGSGERTGPDGPVDLAIIGGGGSHGAGWAVLTAPGEIPVLVLPPEPVSAFLAFRAVAAPLMDALQGCLAPDRNISRAVLTAPLRSPSRAAFLPAARDRREGAVTPLGIPSAAALGKADAVIFVPAAGAALPAGAEVEVLELPR